MKLGILGGTFNPIHYGHLAMAEAASSAHGLDRVVLLPSGRPPHKTEELAPPEARLAMARLASMGRDDLDVSDIEVRRPGVSFTVDTLEEFRRLYPNAELFFLIGEDSIGELPSWRNPGRILDLARVVALNRPGVDASFRQQDFPGTPPEVVEQLEKDRVRMDPCPIESRAIRRALKAGESVEGLIPPRVLEYIRKQGLYRQ